MVINSATPRNQSQNLSDQRAATDSRSTFWLRSVVVELRSQLEYYHLSGDGEGSEAISAQFVLTETQKRPRNRVAQRVLFSSSPSRDIEFDDGV